MSPNSNNTGELQRLFLLDAIRGIAAINVMLMHAASHFGYNFMGLAYFSVDLFFILSGFVIAVRYSGPLASGMTATSFIRHRIIRLYPLHLLGIVIGAPGLVYIACNTLSDIALTDSFISILLNSFYIPYFNFFQYPVFGAETEQGLIFPVNGPGWSLFFEFFINVVFLMTFRWSTRRHIAMAVPCFLALGYFTFSSYGATGWATQNFGVGFIRVIAGFHAGIVIAHIYRKEQVTSLVARLQPLSMPLAILILASLCFLSSGFLPYPRAVYLIAVVGSPLVVLLGAHIRVDENWQSICHWLGLISYPLYCLHMPIIRAAKAAVGYDPAITHSPLFLGGIIASIALASILAGKIFDGPSRRLLQQLLSSKKARGGLVS